MVLGGTSRRLFLEYKNMKKVFIARTSCISPQESFRTNGFFSSWKAAQAETDQLHAIEPDYKGIITDAGKRRRMAHLIKMGVSTSLDCLTLPDGNLLIPDAIMSATAMGGLEDTEKFLRCIIDNGEDLLNPSNFIQSTGNTFGGQTGLLLGHHGYNVTYAHGGYSMESALTDAMLQLTSGDIKDALVTGADEITATEYEVMRKMGFWRGGRQMGEGSSSFLLTTEKEGSVCELAAVSLLHETTPKQIANSIEELANSNQLKATDIDLVLTGCDCDKAAEKEISDRFPVTDYKQWCGQYGTKSGFGLWIGTQLLSRCIAPKGNQWEQKQLKNIAIYSEYRQNDYTLMLLKMAQIN